MKQGMSSLNPYATPYIPLSKQDKKKVPEMTTKDTFESAGEATSFYSPLEGQNGTQSYLQADASLNSNIHDMEGLHIGENFTRNGLQNPSRETEKHHIDEDYEMNLTCLLMMFPNMSEQSLADVYSVNGGDMEASIDMLNQLEVYPADVSEHLPDSLDIGDVSECKVTAEGSSMKLKSISGEASGSSSGPLGSASSLD